MPTVKNGSQTPRNSIHSNVDIKKTSPEALARDDISGAYSGRENAANNEVKPHSTHENSRRKRQEEH